MVRTTKPMSALPWPATPVIRGAHGCATRRRRRRLLRDIAPGQPLRRCWTIGLRIMRLTAISPTCGWSLTGRRRAAGTWPHRRRRVSLAWRRTRRSRPTRCWRWPPGLIRRCPRRHLRLGARRVRVPLRVRVNAHWLACLVHCRRVSAWDSSGSCWAGMSRPPSGCAYPESSRVPSTTHWPRLAFRRCAFRPRCIPCYVSRAPRNWTTWTSMSPPMYFHVWASNCAAIAGHRPSDGCMRPHGCNAW